MLVAPNELIPLHFYTQSFFVLNSIAVVFRMAISPRNQSHYLLWLGKQKIQSPVWVDYELLEGERNIGRRNSTG
jgi:hypothetical protein